MALGRAIRAGAAFVELSTKDGKLVKGLRSAKAKLRQFGQAATAIGKQFLAAATIAAAPIALATRTFIAFSDQMQKVAAISKVTGKAFADLTEQAALLGRTTSFTASEVASAMAELARAGFNPREIGAAIESVLALSRATDTELAESAKIAAITMRQFGLEAKDMGEIADKLTATANNSAQALIDIAEAMISVGPEARNAGESLANTAAAIGILANVGIKGSKAGTALLRAYKNLASLKTDKTMKDLGVQVADLNGDLRPLADILFDVGKATANMGSKMRLAKFDKIFGRGSTAAGALANSTDAFKDFQRILASSAGEAKTAAAVMDAALGGTFRILKSAVEGVANAIGKALEPDLKKLGEAFTKVSGDVAEFIKRNANLLRLALKVIAAVAGIGVGLIALGLTLKILAVGIGVVTGAFALFGTAIGTVGAVLGFLVTPAGLVVAALAALTVAFIDLKKIGSDAVSVVGKAFSELKRIVTTAAKGISDALKADDLTLAAEILFAGLAVVWQKGVNELNSIWDQLRDTGIETTQSVFDAVAAGFGVALAKVTRDFAKAKAFIENAWTNLWASMQRVTENALFAIQSALALASTSIPFGGPSPIEAAADFTKLLKARADALKAIETERTAGVKAANDVRDASIKAADAAHERVMRQIRGQARARENAARDIAGVEQQIRDNLAVAAEVRLRQLVARAGTAAKEATRAERIAAAFEAGGPFGRAIAAFDARTKKAGPRPVDTIGRLPGGPSEAFGLLEKIIKDIEGAPVDVAEISRSVRGTFSGAALGRLGAGKTPISAIEKAAAEAEAQRKFSAKLAAIGNKALLEIAQRTGLR